jgi:ligand-binding SRPBCC domain-containing protein
MKIYKLTRKQFLPISLSEAWDFFSSPKNLGKITPARMNFQIISQSGGERMHEGQIIRYKVTVLPFVRLIWVTEITGVTELQRFTDEQRKGPYRLWRHSHTFREQAGGVEMTDVVEYSLPFGLLGELAYWLFVEREVNRIFDHRFAVLQTYFGKS